MDSLSDVLVDLSIPLSESRKAPTEQRSAESTDQVDFYAPTPFRIMNIHKKERLKNVEDDNSHCETGQLIEFDSNRRKDIRNVRGGREICRGWGNFEEEGQDGFAPLDTSNLFDEEEIELSPTTGLPICRNSKKSLQCFHSTEQFTNALSIHQMAEIFEQANTVAARIALASAELDRRESVTRDAVAAFLDAAAAGTKQCRSLPSSPVPVRNMKEAMKPKASADNKLRETGCGNKVSEHAASRAGEKNIGGLPPGQNNFGISKTGTGTINYSSTNNSSAGVVGSGLSKVSSSNAASLAVSSSSGAGQKSGTSNLKAPLSKKASFTRPAVGLTKISTAGVKYDQTSETSARQSMKTSHLPTKKEENFQNISTSSNDSTTFAKPSSTSTSTVSRISRSTSARILPHSKPTQPTPKPSLTRCESMVASRPPSCHPEETSITGQRPDYSSRSTSFSYGVRTNQITSSGSGAAAAASSMKSAASNAVRRKESSSARGIPAPVKMAARQEESKTRGIPTPQTENVCKAAEEKQTGNRFRGDYGRREHVKENVEMLDSRGTDGMGRPVSAGSFSESSGTMLPESTQRVLGSDEKSSSARRQLGLVRPMCAVVGTKKPTTDVTEIYASSQSGSELEAHSFTAESESSEGGKSSGKPGEGKVPGESKLKKFSGGLKYFSRKQ